MAVFVQQDITNAGLLLLAKVQTGGTLTFSKITVGSGYLPDTVSPRTIEQVVTPVINVDINKKEVNADRTATIGGIFTNRDVTEAFYFRELALFAIDPDLGEILYCYGNAGDTAELIPAHGGSTLVEKLIDIVTIIGSATTVSAIMASNAYASVADIERLELDIAAVQAAVEAAQGDATAALEALPGIQTDVEDLRTRVAENAARTNTLWNAVFTDITQNPWLLEFDTLDGATVATGVWNKTLARLEC